MDEDLKDSWLGVQYDLLGLEDIHPTLSMVILNDYLAMRVGSICFIQAVHCTYGL